MRSSKPVWVFFVYVLFEILFIGMGMGVPIFCILSGLIVGWFSVGYITCRETSLPRIMRKVLLYGLVTSAVTLLGMAVIWLPTLSILLDPNRDVANFGIPLIFYEPLASFIGWMVLMVLVSPLLQLFVTIFSAYLALWRWVNKGTGVS